MNTPYTFSLDANRNIVTVHLSESVELVINREICNVLMLEARNRATKVRATLPADVKIDDVCQIIEMQFTRADATTQVQLFLALQRGINPVVRVSNKKLGAIVLANMKAFEIDTVATIANILADASSTDEQKSTCLDLLIDIQRQTTKAIRRWEDLEKQHQGA